MTRPAFLPSSTVSVNLHVYETTEFHTHPYPGEDRVTVEATGSGGSVTLFLARAELARLGAVLSAAERELTERQNTDRARVVSGPAA